MARMKAGSRREVGSLAPTGPVPTEGELFVRVRYCECDPMGVAHHAASIPWLEMARTELLRGSGVTYAAMEAEGIFLVVTRLETRYRAPARYDDEMLIRTRVTGGGRARLDHEYEVWTYDRSASQKLVLCVQANTTLACVDAHGKPRALPGWLRV